ncbi:MAG TPA: nucleotidyltransferase family protein [Halobacteriales archaeon]|uniref:nucleotidyltransferase family protein n=1 Tax=Candidatus Hikarchaeum yamanae TaxID=2675326 RepID=UPI0017C34EFC|nr:nucleotidyltransferase family protein [Halobacteriales archaeon]|tara:strand:- start:34115 stop:34720 length:606 start_codon:yes stop_codon:yes gene_type:complete
MTIPNQKNSGVLGVLLAGGDSSRFGAENKLFVEIGGQSIIKMATQNLIDSEVESVKIVTGYQAERVEEELSHLDVEFLYNKDWKMGQSTSVRRGIDAVLEENAIVFALGDMPFVKSSSVNELISVQMNKKVGDVFVAGYKGRRGNPVLFRASVIEMLKEGLRGDEGGNSILKDLGMDLVETGDRGVLFDIDTEEDLEDYAQ